jgi:hypothetical protein
MSSKVVLMRQSLAGLWNRVSEVIVRDAKTIFEFAADNMLVVAIIIALIGVILLRPTHTPR